jgi:hypothetical protein
MTRKRFTDADKWEDGWFCDQPSPVKLFWLYLCDRCDMAGVWEVNWKLAAFHIPDVQRELIESVIGSRVVALDGGRKWFIPSFLRFQYGGSLKSSVRPQFSAICALRRHGVDLDDCGSEVLEDGRPVNRNAISPSTRARVIERCGNKCSYCGISGLKAEMTMDHVMPISKGGDGRIENLTAACRPCNSSKSNKIITVSEQYPSSCLTVKDKDKDKDKEVSSLSNAESQTVGPTASELDICLAITPQESKPKPKPVPRTFLDFRQGRGSLFMGKDKAEWEYSFRLYEWYAFVAMYESMKDRERIYYTDALKWLSDTYNLTEEDYARAQAQ